MDDPIALVERYFDAWTSKDFATARGLLADDLHFTGPFETFDSADRLIASLTGLGQVVTGAERRRALASGDEVAIVYDLHTIPVPTAAVSEWYTLRDGKITAIEAYFDARPFAHMFRGDEPA